MQFYTTFSPSGTDISFTIYLGSSLVTVLEFIQA